MATFHGKNGTVTFGSAINNITDWSLTVTAGTAEADVMGVDAILAYAGHYTWTASVTAFMDSTDSQVSLATALTQASLVLKAETTDGPTFTGNAICDSANPGTPVAGVATMNFTFKGSGVITES